MQVRNVTTGRVAAAEIQRKRTAMQVMSSC